MPSTLYKMAQQAIAFTSNASDGGLRLPEILQFLDTQGIANEHLSNPKNRGPKAYHFHPREIALTGSELVFGDFLLLNHCSHDQSLILTDFPSLSDLESQILDGAGILNPFTTFLLAFRQGILSPYEITYESPSGERVRFQKSDPCDFGKTYPNAALQWLDPREKAHHLH